MQFLLARTNFY